MTKNTSAVYSQATHNLAMTTNAMWVLSPQQFKLLNI